MQARGAECLVLMPHYGEKRNKTYWVDGIKVVCYAEPSDADRSLDMGKRAPIGLEAYRQVLKQEAPDIIHFQELAGGNGLSIFHLKEARKTGAKVVITFHLAGYSCRTGDLMFKQQTLCDGVINEQKCSECFIHYKGYERIKKPLTFVSDLLYKLNFDTSSMPNRLGTSLSFPFLIQKLRNNLIEIADNCDKLVILTRWYFDILVRNGIPASSLAIIRQGLPLKDTGLRMKPPQSTPLRIIFIGRIAPYKGIHLLIEALRTIDPKLVSLHIYGSTTDSSYERTWKIASVSMPNVKWMGQLAQAEVIPTISRYHVLCLPSTFSEMSPLVIQEAYAAGIPVIASNTYGNAEQVKHERSGLLFEFNNADDLRSQILRLIEEPDLIGKLRDQIRPPRSFEQVGKEYMDVYRSLFDPVQPPESSHSEQIILEK